MMMSVEVAVPDCHRTLGEGPYWDDRDQCILSVDAFNQTVIRWNPTTKEKQTCQLSGSMPVSFIIPRRSGGYVVGNGKKLLHLADWETGRCDTMADVSVFQLDAGFNDAKCDPRGRIYTGTIKRTMCMAEAVVWDEEPSPGGLYSLGLNGVLNEHVRGNSFSNGLAWTSDQRRLFFVDSVNRFVYVFDYDVDSGDTCNLTVGIDLTELSAASPTEPVWELRGFPQAAWYPDGCCMDVHDKLWVACAFGGKVIRIDPETGQQLEQVELPVNKVTSCCFGGSNLDELFVTTSKKFCANDTSADHPLDGALFKVTGLNTRGLPTGIYEG